MAAEEGYSEEVTSTRTELLFVGLAVAFLALFLRRIAARRTGRLTAILGGLFSFFLFYVVNYRKLCIHITSEAVHLSFGLFRWRVPMDNIEGCHRDPVSLWRIGGAGIHFTSIAGRYRVMFNFLEYPRVVLALRRRQGPVRDVVFSTRRPPAVMELIGRQIEAADSK